MVSCRLGRLKCSVVNMAQSGQVLKAKTSNRCVILLVGLGGPTLMKKTMK